MQLWLEQLLELQPHLELLRLPELQHQLGQPASSGEGFAEPEELEVEEQVELEVQLPVVVVVSGLAWPPAVPSVLPSAGGTQPELLAALLQPLLPL